VTLPAALRSALAVVRISRRAVYLEAATSRYRLIPDDARPCGYAISLSVLYDDQWQPWGEVDHFGVDDILYDKWRVV
jgi:hypothetical protein